MKKISTLFIFFVFIIFTGCAQKSGFSFFSKDKPYERAITYTKKGEIVVSMENKAFIIATYLNPIKNYKDGEYFFVRVYIANDFSDEEKSGLFNPKYHLSLNNSKPLDIKKLTNEDSLSKEMPMVKPWYKLYLVKFPKTVGTKKLIFKSDDYGQTVLIF
ncbi:hypothetical protein [Nitrosophilus kaiyonis]|uniref:hypothetical protein n=1 Tax=Nitrosophilus kaiyonis TaxID=2930200 RepID=UPI0024927C02|nr:hypothetical protein [Nitrosophilus kaiyonis]